MTEKEVIGNTKEDENAYDHIVKYTGLFGGVQGVNMLIGLIRNKVAAFFLGTSGIGLIGIYNKVTGLISQATNFGISFSAVKHVAELMGDADAKSLNEYVCTVRTWSLLTAMLGFFVCIMLSPWLSLWTFENFDYTAEFSLLSLVVAMMAVTGGEIAILKGMKQLKKVAVISVFSALGTLAVSVPLYLAWGISGVLCSLLLSNAVALAIHLYYSSKVVPWRYTMVTLRSLKSGAPMVKLGVAFVLAGIFGQGADYIILSYIQNHGGMGSVGLFNAGYFLITNIGALLFAAVEADYFPRLSSLDNDVSKINSMVNRQIEVCVLLMAPLLMLEILLIPIIVPLLYTNEFMQSAPMVVYGAFYMFFKALTLPIAYLALAKGDSKTYLIAEFLYDVFIALAIPFAFYRNGLAGVGIALSLAGLFDFILILTYYAIKYKFRFEFRLIKIYLLQLLLLAVSVCIFSYATICLGIVINILVLMCSLYLSYRYLGVGTQLIKRLVCKFRHKIRGYE